MKEYKRGMINKDGTVTLFRSFSELEDEIAARRDLNPHLRFCGRANSHRNFVKESECDNGMNPVIML